MIIEKGVEIKGICENLKKILKIIDVTFYEAGSHMVVTASTWGRDDHRDAHKDGRALDVLAPVVKRTILLYKIRDALGGNYAVQNFKTHFHIEYTPIGLRPLPKQEGRKLHPTERIAP